jgi:hypothetical protein
MRHSVALFGLRHRVKIVSHTHDADIGSRPVDVRRDLFQLAGVKVTANRNDNHQSDKSCATSHARQSIFGTWCRNKFFPSVRASSSTICTPGALPSSPRAAVSPSVTWSSPTQCDSYRPLSRSDTLEGSPQPFVLTNSEKSPGNGLI